ncbi:hypothetical protein [Streptomyces sp. NPDC014622]|uniref:hypothetical protein n=1 Tax=Streptomyces sp. NPDC014622 TaxID=3364874 RepID=UPI0036F68431
MKYKNIVVGVIPENLTNLVVTIEWTPGSPHYRITLLNNAGEPMAGQVYGGARREPIGYDPKPSDFTAIAWRGLSYVEDFKARVARSLVGDGHFEWISPVDMSRQDREKFGADK